MQDRPTYFELLEAVQQFIENDVVGALDGTKKFHARVAANVLAIVGRELRSEDLQLTGEWQRLGVLLGLHDTMPSDRAGLHAAIRHRTDSLCDRIRRGDADAGAWRADVVRHIRQTVVDKLGVANPKYLGDELAAAVGLDDRRDVP